MNPQIPVPPKALLRPVGRAIADYSMIRDGDRILLGVSGGKDSLSLLHILRHLRSYAPVKFDLGVITVDPEIEGFDPEPLKEYYDSLGVPWFYQSLDMEGSAKESMSGDSFCSFCSRLKRGLMYSTARREGYNVLALGQHLDDLAESFMMSAFHGGQLRTMKAHYVNDDGDLRIIRPLSYVRERQCAAFAEEVGLPVVPDSCPACFSKPTQRQSMKMLLQAQEKDYPHLYRNLLSTMRPLLDEAPPVEDKSSD